MTYYQDLLSILFCMFGSQKGSKNFKACCILLLVGIAFPLRQLMLHCSHHTMGAGAVVVTCAAWHGAEILQATPDFVNFEKMLKLQLKIFILITLKSYILKSSLSLHRPHLTPASFHLRWRHLSASVGPTIAHLLGKTSEMHLFLPANLQCNIIPTGCKKSIHQILKGYKAIRNFDVSLNPSPGGAGFIKVFDHIGASSMPSCWKSCSPSINTRSGAWKPVANCSHSDMVSHMDLPNMINSRGVLLQD